MTNDGPNPSGLCMCGCGERTNLAPNDDKRGGWVKGKPLKYVRDHHIRRSAPRYRIDTESGCWIWQKYRNKSGYGVMHNNHGSSILAHRVYYEQAHGPIPSGYQVHHTCVNRACVNPQHLVAVAPREHAASVAEVEYWKARALLAEARISDGTYYG